MEAIDQNGEDGGDHRFDASQYAFFGREVTQEVELGGLDDEDEDIEHPNGLDDEDAFASSVVDRDEVGTSSELDDTAELASSFMKLRTDSALENQLDQTGFLEANVLPIDLEPQPSWLDSQLLDTEQDRRQWLQQQQQQQNRNFAQEAELARSSTYLQWGREAPYNNQPKSQGWPLSPSQGLGISPSYRQVQQQQAFPNLPSMMPYGNTSPQSNPWGQAPPPPLGSPITNMGRHPVSLVPQAMHQIRGMPYVQMHPQQQQVFPMVSQGQRIMEAADRNNRQQVPRSPDAAASYSGRKNVDSPPQMRSKYMSAEEIQNLVRIQWAATHSTDPYIDDYYHQAVQAKLAGGTPHGRRHFAPSHLRDLPPHSRSAAEPHAYLQVDALGRIPFSSIRRPRPLLEVEGGPVVNSTSSSSSGDNKSESLATQRRLEQEPMLMARIAVEDGLCLLLDVDDIDRILSSSQPADGGTQLRRRRQLLLEGLAGSLQLVDPLGASGREANGRFGLAAKDDLVFLRLVSLPKGRKLLARYIRLLVPGSELVRIVSMAVFRHLRFLFGGAQSDPASSNGLANAVASTAMNMDLATLSACLAAVVLTSEPPPLRPIGSPSGDGATVIIQAVLDRATAILSDRSVQYAVQNTTVWQASFDAFFNLLSRYCTNKYESIMHSLMMSSSGNAASINAAAASAMSKEMPIELLRGSLPHTNDLQRKRLLEFAQRSIATHTNNVGDGHANSTTAAVRG